jgi:hypothetical protein
MKLSQLPGEVVRAALVRKASAVVGKFVEKVWPVT